MKKITIFSLSMLFLTIISCKETNQQNDIVPQTVMSGNMGFAKNARTDLSANTITLRQVRFKRQIETSESESILVNFNSNVTVGKQTQGVSFGEKKGWDGTVKGRFIVNKKGIILKELSADEIAPGNPQFLPGDPIPGVGVNLGRRPGGSSQFRLSSDANGEVFLPEGLEDGDYWVRFESEKTITEFDITIEKGKLVNAGAEKALVNEDGTIKNFYYEKEFMLDEEIAKNLGADQIIIEKGFYPVDYSTKGEGGKVNLKVVRQKAKAWMVNNRIFEGSNPKGIDCKNWGTACFYVSGERGIDKKDIHRFTVTPIFEKEQAIGIEVQYKGAGSPKASGF